MQQKSHFSLWNVSVIWQDSLKNSFGSNVSTKNCTLKKEIAMTAIAKWLLTDKVKPIAMSFLCLFRIEDKNYYGSSVFFKFLSSRGFVKSRQLWVHLLHIIIYTLEALKVAGELHHLLALMYNPGITWSSITMTCLLTFCYSKLYLAIPHSVHHKINETATFSIPATEFVLLTFFVHSNCYWSSSKDQCCTNPSGGGLWWNQDDLLLIFFSTIAS